MTPYRFDNQGKKKKVSRTRIAVVAFFVAVVVGVALFVIEPLVQSIFRGPAWLAQSVVQSENAGISMLTPKKTIIAENAALQAQVVTYQAQSYQFQQLEAENSQLSTELSYLPTPITTITAQIIGRPSDSLFNTVVLNEGSSQGIRIGQLVTAQHTLGIGTISSVSPNTSTVELFGGPDFSGDVLLSDKNITVPATGKGSGNFEIHIPREVGVADGDLLSFPENPDVTIGVVESIIFDPRDPFQTVLARAPLNIQQLRFVEVAK